MEEVCLDRRQVGVPIGPVHSGVKIPTERWVAAAYFTWQSFVSVLPLTH